MNKAKEVAKSGWHPKGKDGGKESWRGDFKGINSVVSINSQMALMFRSQADEDLHIRLQSWGMGKIKISKTQSITPLVLSRR